MRRRTQLIRDSASRNNHKDSEVRHQYFNIRSQILEVKYGPLDHQYVFIFKKFNNLFFIWNIISRSVTNLSVRHSKSQVINLS